MSAFPPTGSRAVHVPVMPREVMQSLQLIPGLRVVDGTVGAAGHSRLMASQITEPGWLWGFDRDPMMLEHAAEVLGLKKGGSDRVIRLWQGSYNTLPERLVEQGQAACDRLLVDLGLSSDQLADESRGFSFHATGPLDLRFDTSASPTAADLLANLDEQQLADIFWRYGEEANSREIAEAIISQRKQAPLRTAADLANLVVRVVGSGGQGARHPATQTFQALRIATNRELDEVEQFVGVTAPVSLAPGGTLLVITFHSIEDRIVKEGLANREVWELVTKKPLEPTPAEIRFNPRSRSAKLRVARRK
jgi:16S rRNA (cytosine1402-N4)-methyltransferase